MPQWPVCVKYLSIVNRAIVPAVRGGILSSTYNCQLHFINTIRDEIQYISHCSSAKIQIQLV